MNLIPEELFQLCQFIASICIVILLIIEANVLIRLLPLIKKSAENSSTIATTFEKGSNTIKEFVGHKYNFDKKSFSMNHCIAPNDPNHLHSNQCL